MAPTKNAESSSSSSSSQPPPQVQPPQQQQQNQQQQNSNPHEQQDLETHGDTCSIPQSGNGNADSRSRGGNTVFKSGPLYISSKGLGWTSWKKRWFILTRTSLVFFRSDPSAVQQRGSEVNLTLGGIDLNNSGSVVVKADKKLLTVLFPDGRDGRAFTLKADTMEDLNEWKAALENALTQAPNASHVMGQNGIFTNDHADAPVSVEEQKDETPTRSTVIGKPVLLALEDVDGSPSFLEKALRFVEDHGVNTEGILRQAADVDDVEHRIREYEQGRNEFTPTEDAHVIADCLKYVLRELPSSPVPASCCNALLEACRSDRGNRVNAMREAICESFPEPNRRLLQRILIMMQVVASNKNVNRMNTNAVAACMAPLLLRPLLAGDCEIENDFDVGGDGSMQLLQAAAAANHAQAIVITLLEEYASIFGEGSLSPGLYSDSGESGSGTEVGTDDEEYDDDDDEYDGTQESADYTDEEEDLENESNGSYSENAALDDNHGNDIDHDDHKARSYTKVNDNLSSESKTPKGTTEPLVTKKLLSSSKRSSLPRHDDAKRDENRLVKGADNAEVKGVAEVATTEDKISSIPDVASDIKKPSTLSSPPGGSNKRWGRTPGKKNLSMESIDFSAEVEVYEDDADIERLESAKSELQNSISEEVKNNAVLQASLERRKKALYVRREALEKDVERLQEQLQLERDKKSALEAGLKMSKVNQPIPEIADEKLKKDLHDVAQAETDIANLEHKVDDLKKKLSHQDAKASGSTHGASKEPRSIPENSAKMKEKQKDTEAASTHVSESSGKCQIIHWRQGHKDECQPASITYNTDDEKSDSDLKFGEGNEGLTRDEAVLLHSEAATVPIREAIISEPARSSEDVSGESADNKDDLIDKEEAVSVAETSGSSFSGFSSSPRNDSSDDTSLGECLSSSDSEISEPLLDAHVSVASEETCFSNIDDVPSKPLSPKFVHLVESVDNLANMPKLNLLKPGGNAGQNQRQSSSLLVPDRLPGSAHPKSADPALVKSSDFWGTALGSAECVIENRDSSKSGELGKSSLHVSFGSSRDTSAGKVSENRNFISEETPRTASGTPNFYDEVNNRKERTAKRSDEAEISLQSLSSIKAPLPLNPTGLSTVTLRKSKSTSTGSGVVLAPLKVAEVQLLASKTTKARESPDVVKQSAVGADSGRVIDHQKQNGVAVRRINSLNGKSSLKASVLKVVDQWTKPKSLAENEMAGRHGHKWLFSYELFVKLYTNKTELQPCGLINSGNSCFANVVVQCLMFTPPLTTYFLQRYHSRACPNKEQCFTCGFENLVLKATEGKSSLSPNGLLLQLQNIGISLGNGKQEDAHEFLRFVVDTMQSLCIKASEYDMPKTRKLEDTTLIGLTFGGYLRSKIKCMKCQEKSERREKMMDLTVEIDGDISTLEDALRRFTRTEILDGENKYKCGSCKSYERAKKKLKITEPPNVLTIALKRFQSGKFGKLNKLVRFPETLDLAPYVSGGSEKSHDYKLYGVIVHLDVMNAAFSGHYVCYIRNSQNKWYKADDNTVVTSDVERVLTKGAYMLFYARCSPMPPRLVVCNKTEASTNKKRSVPPPVPKATVSRSVSTAGPVSSSNAPGGDRSGNIQSFYSSFQRLQRILEEDSSSDSSSLFDSNSDECSCSTDSTSMDDFADFIFGDHQGRAHGHSEAPSPTSSSSSPSPPFTRHSRLGDSSRYFPETCGASRHHHRGER